MEESKNVIKPRMANLELLRCLAMMMVVVLHYLGKGELLPKLTGENIGNAGMAAWLLEAFCIVAVNVYMLISGYFLCMSSFKLSRLIRLWLQLWMYSVGIGLLAAFSGILPAGEFNIHYLLTLLFPISMGHYWFLTAYIYLYLLLPLIGMGLRKLTKEQMQVAIGLLLFAFCLVKTVLPVRLEEDRQGYDCLWYLCVFLVAAYIRRFGIPFLEKKFRSLLLYVVSCVALFVFTMGLRQVYLCTGSLGGILTIGLEYNHLLPFLASVGLFGVFLKVNVPKKIAGIVIKIAPYTLGVYLLHENTGVKNYIWKNWFHAGSIASVGELVLWTVIAVLSVFVCGILVDMLREAVMNGLHRLLGRLKCYRMLTAKIDRVDSLFQIDKIE